MAMNSSVMPGMQNVLRNIKDILHGTFADRGSNTPTALLTHNQLWRTHVIIYSPSYFNTYLGCIFHRTFRQHYYVHTFRHVQPHKSNHCCSSSWRRVYRHWPHQSILGRLFPYRVSLLVLCYNIYTLQLWSYLCSH